MAQPTMRGYAQGRPQHRGVGINNGGHGVAWASTAALKRQAAHRARLAA